MSKASIAAKDRFDFADLCELIEILRAPDGCPWDREQTHRSIRKSLIEETYEVVEGIDKNDGKIMCEELGDLLLQVVFHADIAKDLGEFDMGDICTGICKKLIYRHPHVFSDVVADTADKVLENWEELKKKEKGQKTEADVLAGVSKSLPSLMRAQKLSKKSGESVERSAVCDSIVAAANKLRDGGSPELMGELLFDVCRLGNAQKLDLEQLLYEKNDKFCAENQKN